MRLFNGSYKAGGLGSTAWILELSPGNMGSCFSSRHSVDQSFADVAAETADHATPFYCQPAQPVPGAPAHPGFVVRPQHANPATHLDLMLSNVAQSLEPSEPPPIPPIRNFGRPDIGNIINGSGQIGRKTGEVLIISYDIGTTACK